MNTPLYVGPVSAHINGADLSWLVGLLVTSPLYFWLANRDSAYRRRMMGGKLVAVSEFDSRQKEGPLLCGPSALWCGIC
jgi:hypothetical protein